jgi:hypothetical protein
MFDVPSSIVSDLHCAEVMMTHLLGHPRPKSIVENPGGLKESGEGMVS